MEENTPHNCAVCGGFEFIKENGYFYCIECQTQCEGIREQVFEENNNDGEDGDRLPGTPFVFKKPTKSKTSKHKGDEFTSWEMLNFVLRGLVDELISAGAPTSLKETTLQMWAYYLQKLEVAFISKDEAILPKLSTKFRKKDCELLFGLKKKRREKRSPRVSSVNAELNTTVSGLTDWCSMEIKKKWRRKAKKAFMEKVAEMSNADIENSMLDSSSLLNGSELDDSCSASINVCDTSAASLSGCSVGDSSVSPVKIERTRAAMIWLDKNREGNVTANTTVTKNPLYLSKYNLMILLYLALLYEGSQIQISDIMRWIREGHLSYYEAAKHLPETCFVQSLHSNIFKLTSTFPSYNEYLDNVRLMAGFLNFVDWPDPDVSELARKYVKELQLPDMFSELIIRFVALIPMSYKGRVHLKYSVKKEIPNYEGRVLAILIVIMKLLFGLDGKTEQEISKVASQLNERMKHKKGGNRTKLFVWTDWVKQLICRDAVLSKYHFPTKHLLRPNSYENPQCYINYCKKWNDENAGLLDKYNLSNTLLRGSEPTLLNTFECILQKLQDPTPNEDENIDFPQSSTPYSLYIQNIIRKSASMEKPLLEEPAMKILSEDLSKCDITYLLQPQVLPKKAEDYGEHLKVKYKSAQKSFKKFKYKRFPSSRLSKDQKLISNIAVIHCGNSKKQPPTPENSDNEYYIKTRKQMLASVRKIKKESKGKTRLEYIKYQALKAQQRIEARLKEEELKKNGSKEPPEKLKKKKVKKKKVKKKKVKKKKSSNMLKFYVPSSKYWVNIDFTRTKLHDFELHIFNSFPFAFSWLLSECAFISEMPKSHLYNEVTRIEKLCEKFLKGTT